MSPLRLRGVVSVRESSSDTFPRVFHSENAGSQVLHFSIRRWSRQLTTLKFTLKYTYIHVYTHMHVSFNIVLWCACMDRGSRRTFGNLLAGVCSSPSRRNSSRISPLLCFLFACLSPAHLNTVKDPLSTSRVSPAFSARSLYDAAILSVALGRRGLWRPWPDVCVLDGGGTKTRVRTSQRTRGQLSRHRRKSVHVRPPGALSPPHFSLSTSSASFNDSREGLGRGRGATPPRFSTDKERQQWFVRQEARLFLYRLEELMKFRGDSPGTGFERDQPFDEFLRREGLDYDFVTRPQRPDSPAMALWQRATEFRGADASAAYSYQELRLFLVPFYPDAASLVARRRVYIHRFIAYVPFTDMDQVLLGKFKSVLSECFSLLDSRQSTLQTNVFGDARIGELLMAIPTVYIGKDFRKDAVETAEDRLTPQNVKDVWRSSFPPCMRRLFGAYMRDHHMRHSGRLQLWLFFKGAGMKLEENLQFNRALWQDAQKFDREHSYTLRHIYGQEGKRADYPPLSCSKIISGGGMLQTPGVGDFHGCPFKHFDKPQLQKLLTEFGLSFNQLLPVLKYKDTNEYQLACREFFMQTHPGSEGEGVGNHPNHFYEASRRYARRQAGPSAVSPAEANSEKVKEEDANLA